MISRMVALFWRLWACELKRDEEKYNQLKWLQVSDAMLCAVCMDQFFVLMPTCSCYNVLAFFSQSNNLPILIL